MLGVPRKQPLAVSYLGYCLSWRKMPHAKSYPPHRAASIHWSESSPVTTNQMKDQLFCRTPHSWLRPPLMLNASQLDFSLCPLLLPPLPSTPSRCDPTALQYTCCIVICISTSWEAPFIINDNFIPVFQNCLFPLNETTGLAVLTVPNT